MSVIEKCISEKINEQVVHYFVYYVDEREKRFEKVEHTDNCTYCTNKQKYIQELEQRLKEKYKERLCVLSKNDDENLSQSEDETQKGKTGVASGNVNGPTNEQKVNLKKEKITKEESSSSHSGVYQGAAYKMAYIGRVEPWSTEGDMVANFTSYVEDFGFFITANEIDDEIKKISCFMMFIGLEGKQIVKSLGLTTATTLKAITDGVEKYLKPKDNKRFEKQVLFRMKQHGQRFDDFVKDLKQQARKCSSDQALIEDMILDQIIGGVSDVKLQTEMLRKPDITYEQAVNMGRAFELDKGRIKIIQNQDQNIDQLSISNKNDKKRDSSTNIFRCKQCDSTHERARCPAYGKECRKCGEKNHYARCCNNKENEIIQCNRCNQKHEKAKCPAYGKECRKCKKIGHFEICCQGGSKNERKVDEIRNISEYRIDDIRGFKSNEEDTKSMNYMSEEF